MFDSDHVLDTFIPGEYSVVPLNKEDAVVWWDPTKFKGKKISQKAKLDFDESGGEDEGEGDEDSDEDEQESSAEKESGCSSSEDTCISFTS